MNEGHGTRPGVAALLLLALLVVVGRVSGSDMFTALAHMQKALHAEQSVSQELRQYVANERARIDAIERIADDFERHSADALDDPERHVANPVNAYLLIKRFTVDWTKVVEKYFSVTSSQEFLTSLYNKTSNFPDQNDLYGSAVALLRLQDTYALPTDKLVAGDLPGVKSPSMTADDCLQLGVVAYARQDWYHVLLWHTKALALDEQEVNKTTQRKLILDYLSFATYQRGNVQHAYNLTLEWLQIEPDNQRARNNLFHYIEILRKQESEQLERKTKNQEIVNERIKDEFRSTVDFDVYERLCRGEKTHNIDERQLTCQFRRHHPMFYISPLKEEVINIEPRILIYHHIMTDAEIEKMKALATPKLHRSGVFKLTTDTTDNTYTEYRTSQSAWIADEEDPLIHRLSQRTSAMSNLTLDTVELFQVLNYGIGGHYEPHYDFARPSEISTFEQWRGNRIATVIFYMSDVEAGGRTVFNAIGVGRPPEKGSCIVWFNLLKNGEGDYNTRHAGCPVLSGNKWVVNKWFHIKGQEFTRPCGLSENE